MYLDRPTILPLDQQLELLNLRADRLCHFLTIATHHARRDPSSAWWRSHVVWALRRLEALGYSFPEVDTQIPRTHHARLAA